MERSAADPLILVDLEIDCARLLEKVQQVRREQVGAFGEGWDDRVRVRAATRDPMHEKEDGVTRVIGLPVGDPVTVHGDSCGLHDRLWLCHAPTYLPASRSGPVARPPGRRRHGW